MKGAKEQKGRQGETPPLFEVEVARSAGGEFAGQLNGLLALQALVALLGVGDSFALAVRQAVANRGNQQPCSP